MMDNQLTKQEQDKYEAMWNIPSYRIVSPGYLLADAFFDFFKDMISPGESITDFGCGSGFATIPFLENHLNIQLVDIASNALADKISTLTLLMPDRITFTQACLWDLPTDLLPTDWIYCMDVLEHIPTEKVDAVLSQIAKRTKKGGALQVFLAEETFGELIGQELHLTVKPLAWWIDKIRPHFEIKGVAVITPNVRYTIFVGPSLGSKKEDAPVHSTK